MKLIKSILKDVLVTSGVMMISPMPANKAEDKRWTKCDKIQTRSIRIGFSHAKCQSN